MKKILLPLIIILLLSTTIACQQSHSEQKLNTIKIGSILPLTGDIATYGQKEKQGIELAIEKLNRSGQHSWQVIFEDSQGDPKQSTLAYQKLSKNNQIKYYLTCCSGMTLAM